MADKDISIIISARDFASKAIQSTEASIKKFSSNTTSYFHNLSVASSGLATSLGILGTVSFSVATAGILRYGDEVQSMKNKIKSVAVEQEKSNEIFDKLGKIAIESRGNMESVVYSFQKFELTNKSLGKSTQDTLMMVDALSKGLAFSGATTAEAAAAQLQLSQAYASGKLQGDEFRSISEAFPLLLFTMQKQLGMTTAEFRKLGSAGGITREIIENGLREMSKNVDQYLKEMPITIGQGWNIMKSSVLLAIEDINNGTKIFDKIGATIAQFGQKIMEVSPMVISFINSISVEQIQMVGGAILGMLIPSFVSLGIAIGGVLLYFSPLAIAGALIVQNWEPIKEFLKGIGIDFDNLGGTFQNVKNKIGEMIDFATPYIQAFADFAIIAFQSISNFIKNEIFPIFSELFKTVQFIFGGIKDFWNAWSYEITFIFTSFFDGIKITMGYFWEVFSELFKAGLSLLRGDWDSTWGYVKNAFFAIITPIISIGQSLFDGLSKIFNIGKDLVVNAWDSTLNTMKTSTENVWNGIKTTIANSINWVIEKINFIISKVNSVSGKAGVPSLPTIPSVAFANGGTFNGFGASGIVRSPIMGIAGEAGPEAIVPLPDGRSIPVQMRGGATGGTQIVVNVSVNGSVMAERDLAETISQRLAKTLFAQGIRA